MPANLLQSAIQNPYAALSLVLGDALHPGGREATVDLLDRAGVQEGTRVVDLGCGAGLAGEIAAQRGARTIGLDRQASAEGADVCATMTRLPLADAIVDVVLSECALCLSEDLATSLAQARRVLTPEGRLAVSDVTLTRPIEGLPEPLAEALCLTGQRSREHLVSTIEAAGFHVLDERDHHEDLVAMRERVRSRVDVEGLLLAMGARGRSLLAGVEELEAALEAHEIGYVSLVARPA